MISRIMLENWRSHKSSELSFEKGTNVIVGVMGAGKSSIMDALCYALFGTFPSLSSKKVAVSEIVMSKPNKMPHAKVRLEFSHSGKDYAVERTVFADSKANQAKLFQGERMIAGPKPTEVSDEIEKILELDFELFSRAIYSEQNQIDSFLRLAPSERKRKFDELLDLEKYERVRSSALQLANSYKKSGVQDSERLGELKKRLEDSKVEEIEERLALKEKHSLRLKSDHESLKRVLEKKDSEFRLLSEARKKHEELSAKIMKDSGKLEEAKSSLALMVGELDGIELSEEKLSLKRKALLESLKKLKENALLKNSLNSEIAALEASRHFLEEEVKARKSVEPRSVGELEREAARNSELLKSLERKKQEIEAQLSDTRVLKGKLEGAIFEQNAFIKELESLESEAACPTCRRKLDAEHKASLLKEAREKIAALEKELSLNNANSLNIEALKKQALADSENAASEKNSLESSRRIISEIASNSEKLSAIEKGLSEKKNSLESASGKFSEKEQETMEKDLSIAEKALQACLRKNSAESLENEIAELRKSLDSVKYSQDDFEKLSLEISESKASLKALEVESSSTLEIINGLRQQLETLRALSAQVSMIEKQVQGSGFIAEKLSLFSTALESAQSEMRSTLVENINAAMHDIWPRVYPYRDFQSAKLLVSDGNYELVVQSGSGEWTRVEGVLSGGERMAAAITIRVAFSLVLTQHLSWLILDEPTHNLDSHAVKVLSEMLKEHLPSLVEQVFVITHDRLLESAASSAVFEMQRDKDNDGATKVVQKSIAG